jgi:signal transduction histidine kinase
MIAMAQPPEDGTVAEMQEAMAEARQLITDLRDAAQDGRGLARRYAEILQNVVDEYCVEFEQRAQSVLARLESVR